MIIDREDLTHSLSAIDSFQHIDVLMSLAGYQINLEDPLQKE
jgi:hypothetical protein